MRDTTHTIVENQAIYDSIKNAADSLNRIISDNITVEALQKSQEFYNTSFLNLQSSFSNFVDGVNIISTILAAITMVLVVFNFISANKLGKKSKEELEKVKNFEKESKIQKDEFEEIKRQFETLKKELQEKIKENDEKGLYFLLKKRCPSGSCANVEIIIKSDTFKKAETGYEEYNFNGEIYNRIDEFDENGFEIVALGHRLYIQYKKLGYWKFDENNPNKINLYLNMAIVLYEKEKIKLEDFQRCKDG